jgi:hypothetical protein
VARDAALAHGVFRLVFSESAVSRDASNTLLSPAPLGPTSRANDERGTSQRAMLLKFLSWVRVM